MKRPRLDTSNGGRYIERLRLLPLAAHTRHRFLRWPPNAACEPPVIWRGRVINSTRWIHLYCTLGHPAAGYRDSARALFQRVSRLRPCRGGRCRAPHKPHQRGFINLDDFFIGLILAGAVAGIAAAIVLPWLWGLIKPMIHAATGA